MGCVRTFRDNPDRPSHTPHLCSFLCVGGVLLSHNPTIAVPSAQSSLATGIGTGPGVPSTLKPPTQTHETTTTPTPQQGTGSVLRQTLYNKHKHNNHSSFCGKHIILGALLLFLSPTHEKHKGVFCVGVLVPVTSNTSPCSQPWPINPIIYREPQQKPHLKTGFPLRCFQRLSLPHVANQPCHWRDNWHTRGTSIPVLSY